MAAAASPRGKGKGKAEYALDIGKWGVADMVMLPEVSEAEILKNLERRLKNRGEERQKHSRESENIYTRLGGCVNFISCFVQIYTPTLAKYSYPSIPTTP